MSEAVVFLPLTQGKVAVIDFDDFEKVGRVKWSLDKHKNAFYVCRKVQKNLEIKKLYLHCELLGEKGIDHINGDGLDNRRKNLRVASHSQNNANRRKKQNTSSPFKGVSWHSAAQKWESYVKIEGEKQHLGLFISETEAAHAYDQAATKYFGEFAHVNFPKQ